MNFTAKLIIQYFKSDIYFSSSGWSFLQVICW